MGRNKTRPDIYELKEEFEQIKKGEILQEIDNLLKNPVCITYTNYPQSFDFIKKSIYNINTIKNTTIPEIKQSAIYKTIIQKLWWYNIQIIEEEKVDKDENMEKEKNVNDEILNQLQYINNELFNIKSYMEQNQWYVDIMTVYNNITNLYNITNTNINNITNTNKNDDSPLIIIAKNSIWWEDMWERTLILKTYPNNIVLYMNIPISYIIKQFLEQKEQVIAIIKQWNKVQKKIYTFGAIHKIISIIYKWNMEKLYKYLVKEKKIKIKWSDNRTRLRKRTKNWLKVFQIAWSKNNSLVAKVILEKAGKLYINSRKWNSDF